LSRLRSGLYRLLSALVVLALVYFAALLFDLVTHPLAHGIGFGGAALFRIEVGLVIAPATILVGALIVWRVPGNVVGPLLMLYGVGVATWSTRANFGSAELSSLASQLAYVYFNGVAGVALTCLLFCFPTGRVYPPRAAWWVLSYALLQFGGVVVLGVLTFEPGVTPPGQGEAAITVNPLLVPALVPWRPLVDAMVGPNGLLDPLAGLAAIVVLVLRYRASRATERQQIKWLVWLSATGWALTLVAFVLASQSHHGPDSVFGVAFLFLLYTWLNAFPAVAIGVAILRYRLWDIDRIINRTLVYGLLTATLLLVYVGSVVGLQYALRALSGEGSQLAIVASTLAIAALFNPLRRWMQALVDRRFYRRKYDAAKTLEAFGARLRKETDLDALSHDVVGVALATMQPAHVSLWLRPDPKPDARSSALRQFGHEEE
jgi:hypothetical protein